MSDFRILMVVVAAVCVLAGCGRKKVAVPDGVEAYCFDDAEAREDLSEVFTDVELIPLEFTGEDYPNRVIVFEQTDSNYFVRDMNKTLHVFANNGKYISSSSEKFGQGPDEFSLFLGYGWNPYSKLIEIITFEKIMFYDREFNLVRTCGVPNRIGDDGQIFGQIFDVSETMHILVPNGAGKNPSRLFLYDSAKDTVVGIKDFEDIADGAPDSQVKLFFRMPDGSTYCSLPKAGNHIMRLRPDSLTLETEINYLPGRTTFSPEELKEMNNDNKTYYRYLESASGKGIIFRNMLNSKKIITELIRGRRITDNEVFFTDRKTGKMIKLKRFEDEKPIFPTIEDIDEEYVYSVIEKEMLAESPKLLLDKAEKKDSILGAIEDESLIVLKYRIRD